MGVQPCCGFMVAHQEPTRRAVEFARAIHVAQSVASWISAVSAANEIQKLAVCFG